MRNFYNVCLVIGFLFFPSILSFGYPVTVTHLKETLAAEKLEKLGNFTNAAEAYETAYEADKTNLHALRKTAEMWLAAGAVEKATLLFETLANYKAYKDLALRALAGIYGRAGEVEKAIYYLEKYQTASQRGLLQILLSDPDFNSIRNDPAFKNLLNKENDYQFPRAEWHPTWSPDGLRIAFTMRRKGENGFEIYTVNPEGGNLHRLTQNRFNETMLRWSPLGNEIAFIRAASDFPSINGIYTINPETGVERSVITIASGFPKMPIGFASPSWCPDGACLVFIGEIEGVKQVFRVDPDGQNLLQLTNSPQNGKGNAAVAPNNQEVCYDVNRDGDWAFQNLYDIECVPLDGSMTQRSFLTGLYWWFPFWSYDGNVFIPGLWDSEQDRFGRLAVVNQDTLEFEYLTPPEMDSWWPAISPNNDQVVFAATQTPFGNDKVLYIINIDGTGMRRLIP